MQFTYKRKIFGFQCDIYGHINNAEYLKLYEEARSETLEEMNLPLANLNNQGIQIFVKTLTIDYKKPIKMGKTIIIKSSLKKLSKVKSIWLQEIFNEKEELCNSMEVTAVFTKNEKPTRLPKEIYKIFQNHA